MREQRMAPPMVPEVDGPTDLRFFDEYPPFAHVPGHSDLEEDDAANAMQDDSLFKDW